MRGHAEQRRRSAGSLQRASGGVQGPPTTGHRPDERSFDPVRTERSAADPNLFRPGRFVHPICRSSGRRACCGDNLTAYKGVPMRRSGTVAVLAAVLLAVTGAPAFAAPSEALVTNGSPAGPFSQNKQNEPAVAVDANHPTVLAAGSNDEIDMEACNAGTDNTCPFTPGVGVSGVYFSFDSGHHWTQPTYSGLSARNCQGVPGDSDPPCTPNAGGPIGTLPWYSENGARKSV